MIVITGLDLARPGDPRLLSAPDRFSTWIAGSSPAMTISGCLGKSRWPSIRIDDRAQPDAAPVRPVIAGTAVHGCPFVPHQEIADLPGMVIDETLLGRVQGELFDQTPGLVAL